MKTIRDTKMFEMVSKVSDEKAFKAILDYCEKYDCEHPRLRGGLDYIDRKEKGIYFHDIGCNGIDNSFVVRREL
jgi:hypothetical protein